MNDSFLEIENKVFHKKLNRLYQSIPFLWNYYDMGLPYEVSYEKKVPMITFIEKFHKNMNKEVKILMKKYNDKNTEFIINCQYKNDKIWYMNKYHTDLYISFHTWLWHKSTSSSIIDADHDINYIYEIKVGFFPVSGKMRVSYYFSHKIKFNKIDSGLSMNKLCDRTISIHHSNDLIKFSPRDSCNFNAEENNLIFFSVIESEYGNCVTLHLMRNVCDNNKTDSNNNYNILCDLQKV